MDEGRVESITMRQGLLIRDQLHRATISRKFAKQKFLLI